MHRFIKMTKILVVYYSLTGNTKFIAEIITEILDADILSLKPIKELNPDSSFKYFWGGFQTLMKRKPTLEEYDINPENYELIVLGTPVWAWRYSPPLRTFLEKHNLSEKKVAFWMCHAGQGEKAMKRFKKALNESEVISENSFQDPLEKDTEKAKEKAIQWANEILRSLEG
ncbi:MAG: flavodoxin [Candidatus Lokiarchaeota archaeon]|nr:flavodoxin [Candidatus Lokiarchaeota archaeon]